ncbi:cytochrome b562 [Oceanospirillum sanctuarii]|uniref:cytochrome b562 n=1 Tax=Oceanospirillum sanctuarii TaxID=1434821 RepID=UPI0015941F91|nr:cytochrome b562 [Oceanospirillum sanctuarii]
MSAMGLKKSLIAVSMVSALFLGATDAMADNHGKGKGKEAGQCGKTELAEQMKEMKDHLKAYKKAAKSEDWAAMSENRAALLELTISAKEEMPFKAQGKPQNEQAKMQGNYKKGMGQLEDLLTQLEAAEQAKDADKVEELMGEIGKQSKKGHRAFKQKCDDE